MKHDTASFSTPRNWSPIAIRRELNRQFERARGQAWDLDREEAFILQEKSKAAKRRPYVYKNNGKGRPRKKVKEFSQEKVRRRELVGKALMLLEKLCLFAENVTEPGVFQAFLIGLVAEERSQQGFDQMRLKKLQALCRQFCGRVPDRFPLPWQEAEVKAFCDILAKEAQHVTGLSGGDANKGSPITADWGCARASADVLDRLLRLGELQSDATFVRALNTYRDTPSKQEAFRDQEWKRIWQEAIDQLYGRTAKVFFIRPVGEVKPKSKRAEKKADLSTDSTKEDVIPLDLDVSFEEPWPKHYLVTDKPQELEELERLDVLRQRFSQTMWSAREEALDPARADGHVASAISFGQTLVAAVRAVIDCRADILAAAPKKKQGKLRKALAGSNASLLAWLRGNLDDMIFLANQFALYGSTDWSYEAELRGVRYRENREGWPALHMQLSARMSKAHLDLTATARELKP